MHNSGYCCSPKKFPISVGLCLKKSTTVDAIIQIKMHCALCRRFRVNDLYDCRHSTGHVCLICNWSRLFSLLVGGKLRPRQRFVYLLVIWMFLCYGLWISHEIIYDNNQHTDSQKISVETKMKNSNDKNDMESFIQGLAPNVPYEYWVHEKAKNSNSKTKRKCASFPSVFDLRFNNNYWQMLRTSNGTFYLYGAYHDNRKIIQKPVIRILGMIDRIEPTVKSNCLFWYDVGKDPFVMPVIEYKYVWNKKWGNYKQGLLQPYLMTCNLPNPADLVDKGFKLDQIPVSVSLTEKECEPPTNNLLINNKVPTEKKRFAVCVKGLDFLQVDLSARLVEWIELLGLLGAEKIFLYELEVHPNVSKALRYYQETGQVELTPISLPGDQPNLPGLRHMYLKSKLVNKRQNELIPYNDCLYRNLYSYDYIALLDTDEVIMPREVSTWNELIERVLAEVPANKSPSSYDFRNVYFWDDEEHSHTWHRDIPRHMHMLQHVYRSLNYTKPKAFVKCFHDVQKVMTLHNHFPFACLGGGCTSYGVDPESAHLQHYRGDCQTKKNCDVDFKQFLVKDTTIWRYKEDLISRVNEVLKKLGFLYENDEGYR